MGFSQSYDASVPAVHLHADVSCDSFLFIKLQHLADLFVAIGLGRDEFHVRHTCIEFPDHIYHIGTEVVSDVGPVGDVLDIGGM